MLRADRLNGIHLLGRVRGGVFVREPLAAVVRDRRPRVPGLARLMFVSSDRTGPIARAGAAYLGQRPTSRRQCLCLGLRSLLTNEITAVSGAPASHID